MSGHTVYETSDEARQDGNKLFLARNFSNGQSLCQQPWNTWPSMLNLAALKAYQSALELDPKDWRPAWNKSAVYLELGDYTMAASTAHTVLDGEHQLQGQERQKVLSRMIKALLLCKSYAEAKQYVEALSDGSDRLAMSILVEHGLSAEGLTAKSPLYKGHVRRLPYTKPHMDDVAEFYNVGHDKPGSMFDALLILNSKRSETLSFFLAGIGDARHFLQTIIAIQAFELSKIKDHRYHVTLNDLKSEVLARDLIFFLLLEQLSAELPAAEIDENTLP
jgi:tetratricopeptide (TPR) repeat protein